MVITVHMANKIKNSSKKPKLSELETKMLNDVADRLQDDEKQSIVAE